MVQIKACPLVAIRHVQPGNTKESHEQNTLDQRGSHG